MTLPQEKRIERSVDSLQKIYAVVIALAIGQAIQILLCDRATNTFSPFNVILSRAPSFFALLVVLVPFYHGMNRHLDICYLERAEGQRAEKALLFDFIVFFLESCLLFAVAYAVGPGPRAFVYLGALLALDMLWALVSHWIHYTEVTPSVITWSGINFAAIVVGLFVGLSQFYPENVRSSLLLVVALARTVFDYLLCWKFYFPKDSASLTVVRRVES